MLIDFVRRDFAIFAPDGEEPEQRRNDAGHDRQRLKLFRRVVGQQTAEDDRRDGKAQQQQRLRDAHRHAAFGGRGSIVNQRQIRPAGDRRARAISDEDRQGHQPPDRITEIHREAQQTDRQEDHRQQHQRASQPDVGRAAQSPDRPGVRSEAGPDRQRREQVAQRQQDRDRRRA